MVTHTNNYEKDFIEYPYSGARYYELVEQLDLKIYDSRADDSESPADDSEEC